MLKNYYIWHNIHTQTMTTKIFLEKIKIYAHHGVLYEEQKIGTYYLIDVEIHTDFSKAMLSDDINDTISYADINDIIHQEMAIPSLLLERVAGRIIHHIQQNFSNISYIKLKITKTNPPMKGEMKGAGIEVEHYN